MDNIISAAMGLIVILIVLIILGSCIKVVPQSRAFVVERLGAFRTVWGVGLHIKVPLFERVAKNVSLKEQVVDFPPQPVIIQGQRDHADRHRDLLPDHRPQAVRLWRGEPYVRH